MLRPSVFTNHFTDNIFDDFFGDSFWNTPSMFRGATANAMKTDIRDLDSAYQIDMELPGFAKDDVQAELKDGYLTIRASHSTDKEEKDDNGKYLRRERYSGSYQRSFYVGDAVTENDIKAKFTDGILTIEVPKIEKKPETEQKKLISIEG